MADADALRDPGVTGVPATPEPAPPPAAAPGDEAVMSLVDHLGELRIAPLPVRSSRSPSASVVGFFFATRTSAILLAAADCPADIPLSRSSGSATRSSSSSRSRSSSGSSSRCRCSCTSCGRSSRPGLTPSERKTVRPWIPLALVFFALGVAIAYVVLPFAVAVPAQLHRRRPRPGAIAAGPYFDFVTTMFLAFGLVMEFPILLVGLSRVGIVTSQRLHRLAAHGHPRHRDLRRGRHARAATSSARSSSAGRCTSCSS